MKFCGYVFCGYIWFVLFKRCATPIQNSGTYKNKKKGYDRVFLPAGRFSLQGSWAVRSKLECQRLPLALQPCFHISHKGKFVLLQSISTLLIVLAPNFKVASGMIADWAFLGSFDGFMYVTTVSAFPFDYFVFFEYCTLFYVC